MADHTVIDFESNSLSSGVACTKTRGEMFDVASVKRLTGVTDRSDGRTDRETDRTTIAVALDYSASRVKITT